MTKHTPGKWNYQEKSVAVGMSKRYEVFGIRNDGCKMPLIGTFSNEANARLIAAAPELLCWLKEALERTEMAYEGKEIRPAWLKDARAAIAKAEGGN